MKRVFVLVLVVLMIGSVFTGCQTQTPPPAQKSTSFTVTVGGEPKTIDPTLNDAVDGAIYINHLFEGLTKVAVTGKVVPGIASTWDMTDGGKKFTFHLRDAKWSDGSPVVAGDFVYAWQRGVDPNTASNYAYQLYVVKNATEINTTSDPKKVDQAMLDTLGVKAIDDKTLEVTLAAPCSYFLEITAFPTLFPIKKSAVVANKDGWARDAATIVTNGAYKLKEWAHSSKIVITKNADYWDAASIIPSEITFKLISDDNTILAEFKNGGVLFGDSVPTQEIDNLKKDGLLKIAPLLGTYYLDFNTTKKPFDNAKVRRALTLAIDRQYIIDTVAKAQQIPAGAFVPPNVPDNADGSDFRKIGGDFYDPSASAVPANIVEAKKLLAEAGYPDGKGFPSIDFVYNTEGAHKDVFQVIQKEWKDNLGIEAKLRGQEWAVFQTTRTKGDYDVARDGWLGDYVDPMTFLDMWISNSGQNNAKWKNPAYDALILTGKSSPDRAVRMTAMHDAEKLLMTDMPICPIYFYTDLYLQSPKLTNVFTSALGFKYFQYASVTG